MALYLNVSNSLRQLSKKLSSNLQAEEKDVFQPQYIVTQTEGMNNWLKLQIADHLGIAANCSFLKPNELIYKLYTVLGGPYPDTLSIENLTWLLYKILGEKEFNDKYRYIANYYTTESIDRDVKRMALAEKTTDLFDQYQIYRPELIQAWNSCLPEECTKDDWQKYLWIRAKQLSGNNLPDKTNIGEHITLELQQQDQQARLKARIPSLHIFGLSIITKYHLDLLFQSGEYIDISYYILNPAPTDYWFDSKSEKEAARFQQRGYNVEHIGSGNNLLTSWGKVTQDAFKMFFEKDELLNSYEDIADAVPVTDTLLHKIQNDIYRNATLTERNNIGAKDIEDGSLTINSCYTVAREVEVLYNYLVHLVSKKEDMFSPRDIVVMVTNIDTYAPYIKAVFNNAPYKFRYSIADESFINAESMVSALGSILKMNRQSFKAEQVLQLLDSKSIRERFGITNVELIRRVVDEANIRFGIDGRTEDDTRYVSWTYGVKRIMYGICMSGSQEYNDGEDALYPVDMVEGSDAYELVRFCHFIDVLIDSIAERRADRSIADWTKYVESVLHNFVCEPHEDLDEEFTIITNQLAEMNVASELLGENISYEIFNYRFVQSLSSKTKAGSFAGGGITFCSLIPMRSIPFKVVALLGLNFDKFPRRETPLGFDLRKNERRPGDRNIKENDKHLFLETVLSAIDYLYLSYIGQNAKDNTSLPPSAVIDELVDYIQSKCEIEKVRDIIITKHPLHLFSRKYAKENTVFYNYLDDKRIEIENKLNIEKQNDTLDFQEISVDSLIQFFKNPFKAYYNKILKIYYDDDQVLLSETEMFDLDGLSQWSLKQELMEVGHGDVQTMTAELVRKGRLPLKNMATVKVDEAENLVAPVRESYNKLIGEEEASTISINVPIDSCTITGKLKVFGNKLVVLSFSKREFKYQLEGYIKYLSAKAQGESLQSYFISAHQKQIYAGENISQEQALNRLNQLVEIYKEGHKKIIPFYPDLKIKPNEVEALSDVIFAKKINEVAAPFGYECTDQYLLNEYKSGYFNQEGLVEEYKTIAEKLLVPMQELFPGYWN
jgi:exodeoxyribonuclease V gamma subunit